MVKKSKVTEGISEGILIDSPLKLKKERKTKKNSFIESCSSEQIENIGDGEKVFENIEEKVFENIEDGEKVIENIGDGEKVIENIGE